MGQYGPQPGPGPNADWAPTRVLLQTNLFVVLAKLLLFVTMGPYGPQPGPVPNSDWAPRLNDGLGFQVLRFLFFINNFMIFDRNYYFLTKIGPLWAHMGPNPDRALFSFSSFFFFSGVRAAAAMESRCVE